MTKEFNHDRVEFYQANDWAYAYYRDRIVEIFFGEEEYSIKTISDCIEVHQAAKTAKTHTHLFADCDQSSLSKIMSRLFGAACGIARELHNELGLLSLFDGIEGQYADRFWDFAVESRLYELFSKHEIQSLLEISPHVIHDMMKYKPLLKVFDKEMAEATKANPLYAAQLIIGSFGAKSSSKANLGLPASLSNQDIDELMLLFLSEDDININYVRVLSNWPPTSKKIYSPSPRVLVTAAEKTEELTEALFQSEETIVIRSGANVSFSPTQIECKNIAMSGEIIDCSYSTQWLMKYTDCGTILNNFIYVFEFIEKTGLLTVPAHKHECSTLMETFGMHALDEYYSSPQFNMRMSLHLGAILGYRRLLKEAGTRLEDAIEWFFNTYILDEFDIAGFHINLPVESTTYLDKCKSVGPEIERILKAFELYVREGKINPAYFPHLSFKFFNRIPSLVQNKYLTEGDKFVGYGRVLFSNQSELAYSEKHREYDSFFEMINSDHVVFDDYHDIYHQLLIQLEEDGFIKRDDESGFIKAEPKACILYWIWRKGAFPVYAFSDEVKTIANDLVVNGYAKYCELLFSPDESDYLNYMFNNAKFSDPLALRNKYDHASGTISDPDDKDIEQDYCLFLGMLICTALKINDELMYVTGKGGVEELVDWPVADDG